MNQDSLSGCANHVLDSTGDTADSARQRNVSSRNGYVSASTASHDLLRQKEDVTDATDTSSATEKADHVGETHRSASIANARRANRDSGGAVAVAAMTICGRTV